MHLKIENRLNKIEKKIIKYKNKEYIIFSSLNSISEKISYLIKNSEELQEYFSAIKLAKLIDLPGWLLVDMTNKIIYQDQIASIPALYDIKHFKIYIGYPEFPITCDENDEYEIFGYFLTNYFGNLILIGAGQQLRIDDLSLTYWFEFNRTFHKKFDLDYLKILIKNTFDNFEEIIDGKEVTIPLSGGFDSRLILDELTKRKIPLKSYSIGSKKNRDFCIAKDIANELNVPFYPINVNRTTLSKFINTQDFKKFWKYSGGSFTLPHFSECMFRDELNFLKEDSIITPGHSLDFLAGSHLPQLKFVSNNPIKLISDYHCIPKNEYKKAHDLINYYLKNNLNTLSSVEIFDFEYRQSRYIVNHIRNFEYIGFKPLLPLFGFKLINYFMNLKYEDLINRNSLLKQYKFSNIKLQNTPLATAYEKKSRFKIFLKRFFLLRSIIAFIRYFTYSGKDTIYLNLGFIKVFYQIFFKGCNHPLALLRLLRQRYFSK